MSYKDLRLFILSKMFLSRGSKSNEAGLSILEAMIAAVIIAIAGLGLGTAIYHLSQSRQKTQLISQGVGVEASLVAALQDAGTYSKAGNSQLVTDIQNNADPSIQPTVTVTLDPGDTASNTPAKTFDIKADPNQPVYLDINNQVSSAAGNWSTKVTLSQLIHDPTTKSYSYAYNIRANPALGNIADIGSSKVASPGVGDFQVSIPTQAVITASQQKAFCDSANYIGMMGVSAGGGAPICVMRAQNKCPKGAISKGYYLQQESTTPLVYSYELKCQSLRTLTCPSQLLDAGVPDATLYSPYSLQSFVPNSLDSSGASAGTGTCVFIAAHQSSTIYPASMTDGEKIMGACPPHYVVTNAVCNMGANGAQPATVTCASSDPAVPVQPGGTSITYPDSRSVMCQRLETQVCCGDDINNCANVWTGQVTLQYTCTLNATTSETINAISN